MDIQLDLFLDCRRMAERASLWLLRHRRPPLDVPAAVAQFKPGLTELAASLEPVLVGRMADIVHSVEASRLTAGVPERLAEQATVWPLLHTGFDLVELADRPRDGRDRAGRRSSGRCSIASTCRGCGMASAGCPAPTAGRRRPARRCATTCSRRSAELTETVVDSAGGTVDGWLAANERAVSRAQAMFTEIRRSETFDMTNLSVALRQLRNLALTAPAPG